MRDIPFISEEHIDKLLTWSEITDALFSVHQRPEADINDILLQSKNSSLLSRAAWVENFGIAVKTATIFPDNATKFQDLPTVQSLVTLFDDNSGAPQAVIDGNLITKWKTAGDSVLGAKLLARKESQVLTILGAGKVAQSMIDAYRELFPGLETIYVWNHRHEKAVALASEKDVTPIKDLSEAVRVADILSSATTAINPFIEGEWLKNGCHLDLIGAFRPDMREAHDSALLRGSIFVDSYKTALHDIGELGIPLASGLISEADVINDFYGLCSGGTGRSSDTEITIFKNGGGAHLDLAVAAHIRHRFDKIPRES
ncbi:MAG: ornithine cyclodeaminase [Gammaproteobacteria bacterium]|nr:ornithine cyclodeaminase [Gammaproteobacteria bacterium]HAN81005.1 ornithine cyclodeaminase [Gammaproteobacteria bacterium]